MKENDIREDMNGIKFEILRDDEERKKDQLKRLQAYVEAIQKKCRVIRMKLSRNWWQRDIDRVWHRVISRIVQGWKRLILPDWRMAREFLHWWFWKICQCIRETYWSKNTVKESKHKMKLYHGTNYSSAINIVNHGIDLKYSKPYLDFGPGFIQRQAMIMQRWQQ